MAAPVVAIVGRPNVGKSSLFNRVFGRRVAVVDDLPGVTRDRLQSRVVWDDRPFDLVDTGGLVPDPDDPLIDQVRIQVNVAMTEADLVWFVIDVIDGVSPDDHVIAEMLHATGKPVLLVAHKADNERIEMNVAETYELGFDGIVAVSSIHRRGVDALLARTVAALPESTDRDNVDPAPLRISIVGRPNAGKSLLTNAILGESRVIVDDRPGTTRDAISTPFTWQGSEFELVDTAGMRRKARVEKRGVEEHSVLRATQSIRRSDVVLLVLDVTEAVSHQDKTIVQFVAHQGKPCILVANKWDLIDKVDGTFERYTDTIREGFRAYDYLPIVFTSALSGQRVRNLLELSQRLFTTANTRVPTPVLNDFLRETIFDRPPPTIAGRRPTMKYATQVGETPPTFVVFTTMADRISRGYERYLVHRLREAFDFQAVPLRLIFRDSHAASASGRDRTA